jgi:hypothetical protein
VSGSSFRTSAIASPGSLKGTHGNEHNLPREDADGIAKDLRDQRWKSSRVGSISRSLV